MKRVKILLGLMLMLTTLFFVGMNSAYAAGESGEIKCQQSDRVLFSGKEYNHFHFQKAGGTDVKVIVQCEDVGGGQKYITLIPLDDDLVYEYFLNGKKVSCSGQLSGSGASVNYSATNEQ